MKYTIFLLIWLNFATSFANPILMISNQIISHSDSINQNAKKLEEKKDYYLIQNKILEERLIQSSNTISNQNSLFTGFSIIYSIITIIIAIIGISLPILTYLFGIRPSQIALKNLEKDLDKRFEDYLLNSRDRQVEQAIDDLKSLNPALKSKGVSYLTLTQYQGYSEQQIFKIIGLLKFGNLDSTTFSSILFTISNKKNDFATEFFSDCLLNKPDQNIKLSAIRYFSTIGLSENLLVLRKHFNSILDKVTEYLTILTWVSQTNKDELFTLLNDKEIVDLFVDSELVKLDSILSYTLNIFQIPSSDFENTYIYKKIFSAKNNNT